ncbi:MAG: phenylalanine--tRNA ligase subunit beta [Candidatus Woesearchaeota archaeon]
MPVLNLTKKEFDKQLGRKLPLEKLRDRISMLGTDLDKLDEHEIIVEIFPNRPDMLSMQGFVRAMRSFLGITKGLQKYTVKKSGEKVIIDKSVAKHRPYTACAIVKHLKFDDERIKEVIQIQEKLHVTYGRNRRKVAIGIYPYEKIKPPITFFAEDPAKVRFQPLEFDRELTGRQILAQHPAGREYGKLLDGHRKFPFFKDADGKILSMPPIINSHATGKISEVTQDVFVECSGFDFRVLSTCLNMIVTALADMGGQIYSMELQYPDNRRITPDLTPRKMKVSLDYISKKLGVKMTQQQFKKYLGMMGLGYADGVLIPAYRAEIMHPVDIVEDIAIAYGFENFKPEIPKVATVGRESSVSIFTRKIAYLLAGLGYFELNTYTISSEKYQNSLMLTHYPLVELANSVSGDYTHLRAWMIPTLLEVFKTNKHHEYPQKIFDTGTVFKKNPKTETGVEESLKLAVASCHKDLDFTEIKQILQSLFDALSLEYSIQETEHPSFIPGRVGKIVVQGNDLGYIGEIHPQVLTNFGIEMPVAVFELDLQELISFI